VRILAFDTATRVTAAALWDPVHDRAALEARDDPRPGERPRHASRLLPSIVELLEHESISWADVDRLAVGVGPGTFTGLRIGIATARALSRSCGIPLAGVSTLESLALGAALSRDGHGGAAAVVAVIDARRREVFAAGWRFGDGSPRRGSQLGDEPSGGFGWEERLLDPQAMSPVDLADQLVPLGASVLAVGDGAVEFRSILEGSGAAIPDDDSELHRVSAINHCRLAAGGPARPADEIRPEYLRLPDAEIARRARGSK
jgi:tRNA threonylcarbamoyladenosine biosynthesis protein TsaB